MLISDWSSDVCSSDLRRVARSAGSSAVIRSSPKSRSQTADDLLLQGEKSGRDPSEATAQEYEGHVAQDAGLHLDFLRSEARRVGKECDRTCIDRWAPVQ